MRTWLEGRGSDGRQNYSPSPITTHFLSMRGKLCRTDIKCRCAEWGPSRCPTVSRGKHFPSGNARRPSSERRVCVCLFIYAIIERFLAQLFRGSKSWQMATGDWQILCNRLVFAHTQKKTKHGKRAENSRPNNSGLHVFVCDASRRAVFAWPEMVPKFRKRIANFVPCICGMKGGYRWTAGLWDDATRAFASWVKLIHFLNRCDVCLEYGLGKIACFWMTVHSIGGGLILV